MVAAGLGTVVLQSGEDAWWTAERLQRVIRAIKAVSYTHLDVYKRQPLSETIKGFKEILDGRHDDLPEQAFYMVGRMEEAVQKGQELA